MYAYYVGTLACKVLIKRVAMYSHWCPLAQRLMGLRAVSQRVNDPLRAI